MTKNAIQTLAWLAAVAAALALAFAAPNESHVMGKLPALKVQRLDSALVSLPEELPANRTLALVAFNKGHRGEIESWITGLDLHQDHSIPWVRMPVIEDPGTELARANAQTRIQARHVNTRDGGRIMPVFTDRGAFLKSTGLSSTEHAGVLVLGRDGQVLARVEGEFNLDKAQALRETLLAANSNFY